MSAILVVEQDAGYSQRISGSLRAAGFQVATATNREAARLAALAEPPSLILMSGLLPGSRELLSQFSRRQGGPGSVVLLPVTVAEQASPEQFGADHLMSKPYADEDLLALVSRALRGSETTGGGADVGQLTSAEIFGDVLAEVEAEVQAPRAPGRTDTASTSPPRATVTDTSDIDRKLEETLSGVMPIALEKPRKTSKAKRRERSPSASEIDDLLDKTLSSLELPTRPRKTKAPRPAAPAAPPQQPAPVATEATPEPDAGGLNEPAAPAWPSSAPPSAPPPLQVPTLEAPLLGQTPLDDGASFEPPALDPPPAFDVPSLPMPTPFGTTDQATADPPTTATPTAQPSFDLEPIHDPADAWAEAPSPGPPPADAAPQIAQPPSVGDPLAAAAFDGATNDALSTVRLPALDLDQLTPADAAETPPADIPASEAWATSFESLDTAEVAEPTAADAPAPVEPAAQGAPTDFTDAFFFEPPAQDGTSEASGVDAPSSDVPGSEPAPESDPRQALDGVLQIRGDQHGEGQPFGDYRLLERVAVGGMAEVWRARRRGVEGFQKTVAIKRILSHLTGSSDFVTMFIDEAKLAAQLTHNNIIQIYDLGKVDDAFFIAMEYVDGKDLRTILATARQTEQPLPAGLALLIIAAVARALDYAHRKRDFENRELGLVHRDVSPQNVLIGTEGEIKLCDFGIVKAVAKASETQMGALKGKLQYMSPEQAWGKDVDARSDIFSLGAVMFEALTGRKLFQADSELGVLDAVRECRVQAPSELAPSLSPEIDRITLKALAKKPDDRYQTAGAMERDIAKVLEASKPVPGQNDLSTYMRAVFGVGAQRPSTGEAAASAAGSAPDAATAAPERRRAEPAVAAALAADTIEPAAADSASGAAETATAPPAADAAKRSKTWLWVALGLLALLALAGAGFLLTSGGDSTSTPATTAPATPTTVPPTPVDTTPAAEASTPEPAPADPQAVDAEATGPQDATDAGVTAGDDAVAGDNATTDGATASEPTADDEEALRQIIDEEMRNRRESIEADFETERQRLEQEIERVRRQGAETDSGGDS
ncbi:MAG: protein kinase [Acidobacteriota bacterium]